MTDHADLIELLRNWPMDIPAPTPMERSTKALMEEAADAIERLSGECVEWLRVIKDQRDDIAELKAQIQSPMKSAIRARLRAIAEET